MFLRDVLPSWAANEENRFAKYYKLLDKKIVKSFKGGNPFLFTQKHIRCYYEVEGGLFVGINSPAGRRACTFPIVKKANTQPRLEKLYAFTHNGRNIIAQLLDCRGLVLSLMDIHTFERFNLDTSEVLKMRKAGTFRDATISDKAAYLLRSESYDHDQN